MITTLNRLEEALEDLRVGSIIAVGDYGWAFKLQDCIDGYFREWVEVLDREVPDKLQEYDAITAILEKVPFPLPEGMERRRKCFRLPMIVRHRKYRDRVYHLWEDSVKMFGRELVSKLYIQRIDINASEVFGD